MRRKRGNPGLRGRLLRSSLDSYVLALETINRLSTTYRVEAFTFLACNAWELLLKARILEQSKNRLSIYYKRKSKEPKRTLSLRDALLKVFPNCKDPIRRNVEQVADLRDAAVHLVINTIPKDVMALFQSLVLNYHNCLQEWFDTSLSEEVPVGMMMIVFDLTPESFDPTNLALRRKMGVETAEWLAQYTKKLRDESHSLGTPSEFMLTIRYNFSFVKNPDDADATIHNNTSGIPSRIFEVPKDPCKTHPFRQKEIVQLVNKALEGDYTFNQYDIRRMVDLHDVKKRPEFYYKGAIPGSVTQYSKGFADWLVEQYAKDKDCFRKLRKGWATVDGSKSAPSCLN